MSAPLQSNTSPADAALLALVASQQQQLEAKDRALALAEMKVRKLEEKLRLVLTRKYGKRSETLSDLQLQLLDLEPGVSSEEIEAESQREPITAPAEETQSTTEKQPANKPSRKHPGRQTLPAHLERVVEMVACTPEQCTCGRCGRQTTVIGYEETEVLDVKPVEYVVRVIKREKRACKSYNCEEQGVQTAAAPERIVPKSIFSDAVIIDFAVNKYCDSLPLYRQQARLKRDASLEVALSTINDAVLRVGELLIPLTAVIKSELLAGGYIQADETPVGVQTHDKRGRNHQGYFWQYGSPGKGVVFDFRMGRDRQGPKQFLGQFAGILQTDGYSVYARDVGGAGMTHAACLAHARRRFIEAVKVNAKDLASVRIVELMDALFTIDREARDQQMTIEQRHALRQGRAPKLIEELYAALLAMRSKVLPKSTAGEAANYTLSLWDKLTRFLEYPVLELSTNLTENSMRPIAIGRKNWLHLGSKEAGPKIAAIFSVVESCRRLAVPIRKYLADVLPGMANRSIQSLVDLTPSAYAAKLSK